MATMKVREFEELLRKHGWYLHSQDGTSHRQYRHPDRPGKVTVVGKRGTDIPIGSLRSMFEQAGIDWEERRK